MILSQMLMIAFITCSIIRMVTPLSRILLTNSMACVTSSGLSPAITSSRSNRLGWVASALATSSRFWLAEDQVHGPRILHP